MLDHSDTIFYSLKLKRTKTPEQVFEKIKKAVKPKGATAKWIVATEAQSLWIDFGDGASETFCLVFDNKEVGGACKVAFPMGGELFENVKKSEWKTLIAILHSVKSLCSEISVDDDYDIAGEYFLSLDYSFGIRNLNSEEIARLDRLFKQGCTNHEAFLLQIFSEDTHREYPKRWDDAIGSCTMLTDPFQKISAVWETYLYETSTLKKKCLREIYKDNWNLIHGEYQFFGDPPVEIYTFCLGVDCFLRMISLIIHGDVAQMSQSITMINSCPFLIRQMITRNASWLISSCCLSMIIVNSSLLEKTSSVK